ncbi:R3H domain-containing protein 1 isoform X2 [Harmonia axyridis]|uniref:R3H domain-containing protein 1 isoform X2 n=1 Tax=Harmonia axyridis TaxID=115357 RepID=UPI001E277AB0|nr:R3H domain-containing protein 1 isoform X2 [Harmonia axyridis]
MPSNKTFKPAVGVKMKQQPSRKKATPKTATGDSVSETISFVIKGKLTPIKPTFVAKKVVRKQLLKRNPKIVNTVNRKKSPGGSVESKPVSKDVEVDQKCRTIKTRNVTPKPIKKRIIKKPAVPLKQNTLKKTQKSKNDTTIEAKAAAKDPEKNEIVEKIIETKQQKLLQTKNENKKKKTITKLLKQASEVLEGKKPRLNPKRRVNKTKPKISKTVTVDKTKQEINIDEPKNKEEAETVEECKIEIKEKQPVEPIKTENRDDSTSDDTNLEEIRKTLKGSSNKETMKEKSKKPIISRKTANKSNVQKTKSAVNKIKKARLEEQKLRKLKLFGFWNGPKRKRVASLNAIAKVHCLYENEGKISMLDSPQAMPVKKEVVEKNVKPKEDEEEEVKSPPPQRSLRCVPGLRGVGKHWDMNTATSSSSEDISSDEEPAPKKIVKVKKEPTKKVVEEKVQKKRKRRQTEIIMDLKDMVVKKRMASLNATAILAASYSQEKRSPRSPRSDRTDDTDSSDDDLMTDEEPEEEKKCYEDDVKREDKVIEVHTKPNKKVAVIVNQDTDVTITGVYVNSTTRSTHHEGYCSIAGMQYRISATSHTQTAATAVSTETLLPPSTSGSSQENSNAESSTPTAKSYKPLDALSNMRPPSDGVHHGHQGIVPTQHVMAMSPSGVRHSCTSAFSAPHPSAYHHVGPGHHGPPPMNGEPGYIHGYYQPAGPLITVPLGHGQPPLAKSAPLSETSPTTPSPLSSHPPHPPPSTNGDSSDSEVIITSVTAGKDIGPPPPPLPQGHSYRYSQYPPNVPPTSYSYPYSSHYYHPSPAPPTTYPPHDVCYSPGPYVHHKFPPTSYRRYLGGPQYYPPNPPPSQEIYAIPAHAQPSQQVVTTTPASGSGAPYQTPLGPTASSAILDSYPPTLVETYPAHYYPGYPNGPPSTCYSHAPPPRAVPFINGAYQNCPCPMQSCPKNGVTGPLIGDSKRSSALPKGNMPTLPPVALALPKEPTSDGPPSPARGSAGMPPPPSPAGATYQQQPTPPAKQESISPQNQVPVEKTRRARVGKAMVRNNIHNTMLLMCKPLNRDCVKREIESPKEKEVIIVPDKDVALKIDSNVSAKLEKSSPPRIGDVDDFLESFMAEPVLHEPAQKVEEKPAEPPREEETVLEPVLSTVGENVKVKNMKRKLSLSVETKEDTTNDPAKKQKKETNMNGSYKNLIKKNTSSVKINNGKRKLIQESNNVPLKLLSRASVMKRRREQNRRNLCSSNNTVNTKKPKQTKSNPALVIDSNTKQNCKTLEVEASKEPTEIKENKRGAQVSKSNQKLSASLLDNLIAKNNVDRTIECVVSDAIRTSGTPKKTEKVKEIKEPSVPTPVSVKKSTKKPCKQLVSRRKSKCKNVAEVAPTKPFKPLGSLRWSNGWNWEGKSFEAKVFFNSDETTVIRKCYSSMRHHSGDLIEVKDCVLLKAGARRNELPFVAKIAALWENPEDGEMMMSLLWYYRPEHTDQGRQPNDQPDEVFASRHKDSNSVACIDDKCYVLTYNEYCRYRKRVRQVEEGIEEQSSTCIPTSEPYPRSYRQPPQNLKISPEMVFFCKRVYDFRQKRIMKNPS